MRRLLRCSALVAAGPSLPPTAVYAHWAAAAPGSAMRVHRPRRFRSGEGAPLEESESSSAFPQSSLESEQLNTVLDTIHSITTASAGRAASPSYKSERSVASPVSRVRDQLGGVESDEELYQIMRTVLARARWSLSLPPPRPNTHGIAIELHSVLKVVHELKRPGDEQMRRDVLSLLVDVVEIGRADLDVDIIFYTRLIRVLALHDMESHMFRVIEVTKEQKSPWPANTYATIVEALRRFNRPELASGLVDAFLTSSEMTNSTMFYASSLLALLAQGGDFNGVIRIAEFLEQFEGRLAPHVVSALITALNRVGRTDLAWNVYIKNLATSTEGDAVTSHSMMAGAANFRGWNKQNFNLVDSEIETFLEHAKEIATANDGQVDPATFLIARVALLGRANRLDEAETELRSLMNMDPVWFEVGVTILMNAYSRFGRSADAIRVEHEFVEDGSVVPTVKLLSVFVRAFAAAGDIEGAVAAIQRYKTNYNVEPNAITFSGMIAAFVDHESATLARIETLLQAVEAAGFSSSSKYVLTPIIQMMIRSENIDGAMKFLDLAQTAGSLDTVMANTVLSGFAKQGDVATAEKFMEVAFSEPNVHPSTTTLNVMILCYSEAGNPEGAMGLLDRFEALGVPIDIATINTLVSTLLLHHPDPAPHIDKAFDLMKSSQLRQSTRTVELRIEYLLKQKRYTEVAELLSDQLQLQMLTPRCLVLLLDEMIRTDAPNATTSAVKALAQLRGADPAYAKRFDGLLTRWRYRTSTRESLGAIHQIQAALREGERSRARNPPESVHAGLEEGGGRPAYRGEDSIHHSITN